MDLSRKLVMALLRPGEPPKCPYCHVELGRPKSGRPRIVCPAADCQRAADAERHRQRRRARAGIPERSYDYQYAAPQVGGRYSLLRRMAWDLASVRFPNVTPTEYELVALEAAVRAGARALGSSAWDLSKLMRGGTAHEFKIVLTPEERAILRQLDRRNNAGAEASPRPPKIIARPQEPRAVVGSGLPGDPSVVGQLPAPFSRPGRARGATSRGDDMAWLGLPEPPRPRKIELPPPAERELVDLPVPKRSRDRD